MRKKTKIKEPSALAINHTSAFLEVTVKEMYKQLDNCSDATWQKQTKESANKLTEVSAWLKELYISGEFK